MKTEIIESEVEKKEEYPKLMVGKVSGNVILFTTPYKGVYIHGDCEIGKQSEGFEITVFKPFTGKLVLSND